MDPRKLTELLRATIDPNQQKQAEDQLNQVKKILTKCSLWLVEYSSGIFFG